MEQLFAVAVLKVVGYVLNNNFKLKLGDFMLLVNMEKEYPENPNI